VQEYGLRQIFPRVAGHAVLAGLNVAHLRDWRGESTILPSRLKYRLRPRYGPTVEWCGIPVTRLWRCGNRGDVASVLIEKPAQGDFLPVLDGGYNLQYSPLLEYREGKGLVVFCQVDVTGRSEVEPAAEILLRNLLGYVSAWRPSPHREVLYAGDPEAKRHLESVGISARDYTGQKLSPGQVLVLSAGGGKMAAGKASEIVAWLKTGGKLLAIGLNAEELTPWLPFQVSTKSAEHISSFFDPFSPDSVFAGIGPADVHNRDPRELPLLTEGARIVGDGVLAQSEDASVIFCQMAPWEFAGDKQPNLKRTYRRASFMLSRLLANLGIAASTPLLDRVHNPASALKPEERWLSGLYVDTPEEWDDPYRFFRW